MRHFLRLSGVMVLLAASTAHAQNYASPTTATKESKAESENEKAEEPAIEFAVSGQVRLREEMYRHIFSPADPGGNDAFDLAHLRSRAALTMKRSDLSAIVEMQDIRWLGQAGTTEDSEGMDLRRGLLRVDKINDSRTWLEAGRMVIAYGDQRLIGSLEWVNQARTFDGGRIRLIADQYFTDAWLDAFFLVTRETKDAHDDQYFGGVYTSVAPGAKGWKSELYALSLIDRLETAGESGMGKTGFATLGTRQAYKNAGVDAALEAAAQFGQFAGDDLATFAMAARVAYTAEEMALKPRVGCELVYGTGDSDFSDGDQNTFQNLFPTNHLHYGYADQAAWSNLTALRLSTGIASNKVWGANLDYHHLRLSDPAGGWFNAAGALIRSGNETASAHLGDEVDLVGTYWWRQGLTLQAGYALFVPGAFVDETGGGEIAHFGYLQLAASLK